VTKYYYKKIFFSFCQKFATKKITQPLIYSTHPNVENMCAASHLRTPESRLELICASFTSSPHSLGLLVGSICEGMM
jgi:hypothetical protein